MSGRTAPLSARGLFVFETRRPSAEKSAFFERLREFAAEQGWSPAISNEIQLILEEWLADVIAYGVSSNPHPFLRIEIVQSDTSATIIVTDNGIPFDPTQQPAPDLTIPAEERPIGGLGIFMMRKLSAQLRHRRESGHNVLVIEKDLRTPVLTKA